MKYDRIAIDTEKMAESISGAGSGGYPRADEVRERLTDLGIAEQDVRGAVGWARRRTQGRP